MFLLLVKDQLDAQFFFLIRLFQCSACSEQPSAHRQESQLYQYNVWYMSLWKQVDGLCRWPSSMQVGKFPTCILDDHLHRATYTRRCVDTIDSPDDEH
jgi:hypothetical protein